MTGNILQEWTLQSENGGNIQLTFVSFDVEYHSSCAYDYIEVMYGDYSERFCGGENGDYLPGPFTSCGSSMVIKFHSDSSATRTGFRADWEKISTATPCSTIRILSHADYPNSNYPDNLDQVEALILNLFNYVPD